VPTDLQALLYAAVQPFEPRARQRGLSLSCEIHPDLPNGVLVDPGRLRQIVVNLLGNALKFTSHGGVTLAVSVTPGEEGRLWLSLVVRDTGIGIAAGRLTAIFQPFTQADGSMTRRYGGTGLGLTICARLVSLMGGTLDVRSTLGTGSEFTVRIPVETTPLAAEAGSDDVEANFAAGAEKEPTPAGAESAPHVLVAEDNPVNQRVVQQLLSKRGWHVTLTDDGRQAVAAFEQQRFDLVLMDLQMPEMNGFDAVAAIRALEHARCLSHTPIVAVTAHAMAGDRERCLEAGMDGYLTKPMRREAVYALLDELMGISSTPAA
jgi:CheY-like chemotaxis protein